MNTALSQILRSLHAALEGVPAGVAEAELARARDRLERDLLPRTSARDGALVAGIVGPNNAGKSAIFNALVGSVVSPSLATGGATRRLVGAARPQLARELSEIGGWDRFRLIDWSPERDSPDLPTLLPERPDELLLVQSDSVPKGVLLIDTPDFDSVMRANRESSEALLAVADLALVVVTRHTYQNAALVDYMRSWLEHGRPWILIYNEAPSRDVALEHAAKLAQDLGSRPLEIFHAPNDLAVMGGERPLHPTSATDPDGPTLAEQVSDLRRLSELKQAALSASLAQLVDDVRALASALEGRAESAGRLHAHAAGAARAVADRIAGEAMPAGPFLAAFREVLDRRSNRFSRRWRSGLGALRVRIEQVPRLLGVGTRGGEQASSESALDAAELPVLDKSWPPFYEALARDLGPEGRAAARRDCPAGLSGSLDVDLEASMGVTLARARAGLRALPVEFEAFQAQCEELVERALEERGTDLDLQALADLATVLPVAFGAVLIVKTGGFGADLGVAGGSMATSFLLDKYKHVLGSGVTREARRRWVELRGAAIAEAILDAALPTSATTLSRAGAEDVDLARELEAWIAELVRAGSELEPTENGGDAA